MYSLDHGQKSSSPVTTTVGTLPVLHWMMPLHFLSLLSLNLASPSPPLFLPFLSLSLTLSFTSPLPSRYTLQTPPYLTKTFFFSFFSHWYFKNYTKLGQILSKTSLGEIWFSSYSLGVLTFLFPFSGLLQFPSSCFIALFKF